MPELTTAKSVLLTDLALCVNHYRLFTPGIYVCVHVPVTLDKQTRLIPGLIAMANYGTCKQCEAKEDGFHGPPNFVLDVFSPDEADEYRSRRETFEMFGLTEYVAAFDGDLLTVNWNRLDGETCTEVTADKTGMIKSSALPGMWFPVEALKRRDWWTILSTIERGVTRLGHHEFQESIWNANGRPTEGQPIPFDAG